MAMFMNKTKVLLVLTQDVLDEARVLAGRATAALKLPVSLQIVLRALIEEGLKRDGDRALLANVEDQAVAVRRLRSLGRRAGGAEGGRRNLQAGSPRKSRDRWTHRGVAPGSVATMSSPLIVDRGRRVNSHLDRPPRRHCADPTRRIRDVHLPAPGPGASSVGRAPGRGRVFSHGAMADDGTASPGVGRRPPKASRLHRPGR